MGWLSLVGSLGLGEPGWACLLCAVCGLAGWGLAGLDRALPTWSLFLQRAGLGLFSGGDRVLREHAKMCLAFWGLGSPVMLLDKRAAQIQVGKPLPHLLIRRVVEWHWREWIQGGEEGAPLPTIYQWGLVQNKMVQRASRSRRGMLPSP